MKEYASVDCKSSSFFRQRGCNNRYGDGDGIGDGTSEGYGYGNVYGNSIGGWGDGHGYQLHRSTKHHEFLIQYWKS